MAMTVSLSKGKKLESNFKHNERKTKLNGQSPEVVKSFYETENHKHIKSELTRLNVDQPHENFVDVYDRLFGKAIKEYNGKQKRKDRKIGKGKAVDGELKKNSILAAKIMLAYLSKSGADRKKFVQSLGGQQLFESTFLEKHKGKTEKDLKKELAFWESQETYGEAYYKKIKTDNKTKTHTEFIAQLGSAEDFNFVKNGEIVRSYDREDPNGKWQKAKKVLKEYMNGFQDRNPNLVLVGYSIHMDEASPHVHFDVVPVADQSKTKSRGKKKIGLSKKLSFDGALQSQGFSFSGNPKKLFTEWQHQETNVLADLMQKEMGEKRKVGKTNNLKDIHEYKKLKQLEVEKLKKVAELDKTISQKETTVRNLNTKLTEGIETVKKVQVWADNKSKELGSREKQVKAKELTLSRRENVLKQSETKLESQKRAFDEKIKKKGDLDQRLKEVESTLTEYNDHLDKKKKEILAKKQKELDKKKAEQLDEYKKQVERQKQAYIDEINRQYRQSLEQREKAIEQREKRFAEKIKSFATSFQRVYISEGLRSMYGTERKVSYYAEQYLHLSKDQQKVVEKQAFSGPAGLYRKISAFKKAVDYIFHGSTTEKSPLQALKELAKEAETSTKHYDDLNGHVHSSNLSRSADREL